MLATVWSASLQRVSLFLGVVSAMGIALGFATQDHGVFGSTFSAFALVALPLALVLGLATFVRSVELQREAFVYITSLNRIRQAVAEKTPASRPYFVLSIYDDASGVYPARELASGSARRVISSCSRSSRLRESWRSSVQRSRGSLVDWRPHGSHLRSPGQLARLRS